MSRHNPRLPAGGHFRLVITRAHGAVTREIVVTCEDMNGKPHYSGPGKPHVFKAHTGTVTALGATPAIAVRNLYRIIARGNAEAERNAVPLSTTDMPATEAALIG